MDEEPMDINKSFFIKQTTNISRTRIDSIKYKSGCQYDGASFH